MDCLLILAVVLISALPYVGGLGFYLDDWVFQANPLVRSGDGIAGKFRALVTIDMDQRVRPVQAAYLATNLTAFGSDPVPYHVVGTVLLGVAAVLLYAVLVEIRIGYRVALAVSILYELLPQYSTDRIWLATHQALLCMLFAMLGIYALLRSMRGGTKHQKMWVAVAIFAFALSLLSYEVALGLIAASLAVAGWRGWREARSSRERRKSTLAGFALMALVLLAIGIVKIRMQQRMSINLHLLDSSGNGGVTNLTGRFGSLAVHAATQAIQFNFWSYFLRLPWVITSLWQHSALTTGAIASAAIISVTVAAALWFSKDQADVPGWRACLRLIAAGLIIYGLGVILFVDDLERNFSAAGNDNRVTIAAALGEPFLWVALAGLLCGVLRSKVARTRVFSVMIGLICGMNCLAMCGIAYYWKDGAKQQTEILRSVDAHVHSLPQGSVLLLDGTCRFTGPAFVFITDWDTTAAIDVSLKDDTVKADLVTPDAQFGPDAVQTTVWDIGGGHHPYGDSLFVYNVRHTYLARLSSKGAADAYLQAMNPAGDYHCPYAPDGDGVRVF